MTSTNPVTSRVTHRSSLEIVPFVPCNQVDTRGTGFYINVFTLIIIIFQFQLSTWVLWQREERILMLVLIQLSDEFQSIDWGWGPWNSSRTLSSHNFMLKDTKISLAIFSFCLATSQWSFPEAMWCMRAQQIEFRSRHENPAGLY